jgi:membrane protease YdiL (CAAX protease family)
LDAKRKNSFFSIIFVTLFLAIFLYVFLTFLVKNLQWEFKDSARVVEAIFLTACILIIRKSGFSISYLGVTLRGAVESIRVMAPGTLIACLGLIGLKGLFIVAGAKGMYHELFIVDNFDLLFIIYLPVAFLQEFLSRGVIQTAIASVLDERNANFWAIITASALFGLVHIQLSVGVAFASFVCGLYWGYVFNKKKCLIGVSLSHFLIGDLAYVLGFWDYLHII